MSIDPTKVAEGSTLWLTEDQKEYKAGTAMVVQKVMNLNKQFVVMLKADPAARAIAVQPQFLSDVDPSGGAAPEGGFDGPVQDLFASHAPMDQEVAIAFFSDVITACGPYDTSVLEAAMELSNIPAGGKWSVEQTAQLYSAFAEMNGLPVPEIALAVLTPPAANAAPAAQEAAAAKPKGGRKTKAEEAAPAPAEAPQASPAAGTPVVDRKSWTATRMDAVRFCSMVLPIFLENLNNIDEIAEEGMRLVKKVLDIRK